MASTTERMIGNLAKKYSYIRFVESDTRGLYYAIAPGDDRLAVLCGGGVALLTIEQLYTLRKEAIDVWTDIVDDDCKRKKSGISSLDWILNKDKN